MTGQQPVGGRGGGASFGISVARGVTILTGAHRPPVSLGRPPLRDPVLPGAANIVEVQLYAIVAVAARARPFAAACKCVGDVVTRLLHGSGP
jgi:hypothetical protein